MSYVWMRDPPDSRDPRETWERPVGQPNAIAPAGYVLRPEIMRDHNCSRCRDGERACVEGAHGCSWPHARND